MARPTQIDKAAQLMTKARRSGPAGQFLVEKIVDILVDFCLECNSVTVEPQDCPGSNPNCDEPGDDQPGGG